MTATPTLAVVGPGRVGWALATGAARAGYRVAAVAGGAGRARVELAAAVGGRALESTAAIDADLVLLTVPDPALASAAAEVRAASSGYLVHAAGALPASALGVARAGTFHPLHSFAEEPREVDLSGCGVAIEADVDDLAAILRRLAGALGMVPLAIPPAARARYHAAAVLAGNGPQALLDAARRQLVDIGVDAQAAGGVLAHLLASVSENVGRMGIESALTGPVRRGDVVTVRRNLEALERADAAGAELYRALARATVDLAVRLPDGPDGETAAALLEVIGDSAAR